MLKKGREYISPRWGRCHSAASRYGNRILRQALPNARRPMLSSAPRCRVSRSVRVTESGSGSSPQPEQLLCLLEQLADGEPRPVAHLAAGVGVLPGAVEAWLPLLVDHGVRQRQDGTLRIPGGLALLDAERIEAAVANGPRPVGVTVLGVTGSTNDVARKAVEAGRGSPFVVFAEAQTAGRGRRGRGWASPVASNLYLSHVEPLPGGLEGARGLSLVAGVAAAEAIEAATGVTVALKWPNDLLVGRRKLGGILVELVMAAGRCHAVVGVGLNVRVPAYVGAGIDQAWTDLTQASKTAVDRNVLAAAMVGQLARELEAFRIGGFDVALRARWEARDPYRDQRVVAQSEGGALRGWARGIDEEGALLIEAAEGMVTVGAGDVSLRSEEHD